MLVLMVSIRILRAKIASLAIVVLWSWLDAIGLMPTASNAMAPIMMLIRRPGRRSRCVTLTIRHLHEFACAVCAAGVRP